MDAPGTHPLPSGTELSTDLAGTADPADVAEQQRPLVEDAADLPDPVLGDAGADLVEADPADRLDQLREVPLDEDEER